MIGNFSVNGMSFHAFHGDMEVERELGQIFSVDVAFLYDISDKAMNPDTSATLQGAEIYEFTKEVVMSTKFKSIDGLALAIAKRIFEAYEKVQKIRVSIARKQLFIAGDVQSVVVGVSVDRQDIMGE